MWTKFSGCSVRWIRESLNLQLLSPSPLPDAPQITIWLFAPFPRGLGTFPDQIWFWHFLSSWFSSHMGMVVCAGEFFSIWVWNFFTTLFMDLVWPYQVTHWPFLNGKGGNIQIFVLTYDEKMGQPLSKQSECENIWGLKHINYIFNSCKLCPILQQKKFRCWFVFYDHPLEGALISGTEDKIAPLLVCFPIKKGLKVYMIESGHLERSTRPY